MEHTFHFQIYYDLVTAHSSGLFVILIYRLLGTKTVSYPHLLFMDEPEASLHIEWQQKLIGMIRNLNPNVQLILTTHSPAVIMERCV